MKKNKYIALFAGLSLALMSSPALAYPSPDTLLVSGYDAEEAVVLYGVSDIDQEGTDDLSLDCTVTGEYTYELGEVDPEEESDFETRDVVTLEKDGPATFGYEDVNTDGDYTADLEVEYGDDTDGDDLGSEECELTAVTIEHPGDGEINHGTIVSTFARLLQGGNGCLIRHFAQSDYGKADNVDGEGGDAMTVLLSSQETACKKGPGAAFQAEGDDDDTSSRGGPPPWAGKKGVEGDDDTSRGGPPPWAGKKGNG